MPNFNSLRWFAGDRRWALALGLALAGAVLAGMALTGATWPQSWCAAVVTLCAAWWILEPAPLGAVSLIPFAVFPLAGVLKHDEAGACLGDSGALLLLGGFLLSAALEKSGVHRRLALGMVRLVGGRGGAGLVLGFMLAAGLLSMWISNAGTALMLLPVAMAVLEKCEAPGELGAPLLLGLAYACSIGGMGTPIGTPPNLTFLAAYRQATGETISFSQWMVFGAPTVALLLPLTWLWLVRGLRAGAEVKMPSPGPWTRGEALSLGVFALTALAWITRSEPWGGWRQFVGGDHAHDATVALAASALMFLTPTGDGGRLLDWPTARKIPWELLLLVGGGVALAKAFDSTGLDDVLARRFAPLAALPTWLMIALCCVAVSLLTEFTSNTATAALLMPLLAAAAKAAHVDPKLLMGPAVLSVSCAFMLPVGTLPNAIIMRGGHVSTRRMVREGLMVNAIGVVVISLTCYFLL